MCCASDYCCSSKRGCEKACFGEGKTKNKDGPAAQTDFFPAGLFAACGLWFVACPVRSLVSTPISGHTYMPNCAEKAGVNSPVCVVVGFARCSFYILALLTVLLLLSLVPYDLGVFARNLASFFDRRKWIFPEREKNRVFA